MEKDISEIPKGMYCYTCFGMGENGKLRVKRCPYWSRRLDKPEQEDGYCGYLEKGDWDDDFLSLLWDSVKDPDCPVKESEDENQVDKVQKEPIITNELNLKINPKAEK